jgi:hypothetical protein
MQRLGSTFRLKETVIPSRPQAKPRTSEGSAVCPEHRSASFGKQAISIVAPLVALLGLAFATATQAAASPCASEFNKIVRTAYGRITSSGGKVVPDGDIVVVSSSGEAVFKTKSKHDGTFYLAVDPGKYRVVVRADGHLRFSYVVDLRSAAVNDTFDVPLQNNSECHDMHIVDDEEDHCNSETVTPNLVLATATVIAGQLKDETSAPFKDSPILLRKVSGSAIQPWQLEAKTDANGYFRLEEAEPGEYRLIASPNRGFGQPDRLDCYKRRDCALEIVLKLNPTDQMYAACPVK